MAGPKKRVMVGPRVPGGRFNFHSLWVFRSEGVNRGHIATLLADVTLPDIATALNQSLHSLRPLSPSVLLSKARGPAMALVVLLGSQTLGRATHHPNGYRPPPLSKYSPA